MEEGEEGGGEGVGGWGEDVGGLGTGVGTFDAPGGGWLTAGGGFVAVRGCRVCGLLGGLLGGGIFGIEFLLWRFVFHGRVFDIG